MLEVEFPSDMKQYVGQKVGSSDWLTVDQKRIDDFAAVSGDHNWIHIDRERAKQQMPDGKTIAHGMLTLSLVTYLASQIVRIKQRSRGVNYGQNKVRFVSPVQSGARIRLHRTLEKFDEIEGGARLTYSNTVEIEGVAKPALVAETLTVVYK